MKIISWNVNGFRSIQKKGFLNFVNEHNPDILCLQETRMDVGPADINFPQYDQYWNAPKLKRGYSGTATFTKVKPSDVIYGIEIPNHDEEGRMIPLEFDAFYLVNVY